MSREGDPPFSSGILSKTKQNKNKPWAMETLPPFPKPFVEKGNEVNMMREER